MLTCVHSFFFKCDFTCVFCMITGMVFLYVNVCLDLSVSFVILYIYCCTKGQEEDSSCYLGPSIFLF